MKNAECGMRNSFNVEMLFCLGFGDCDKDTDYFLNLGLYTFVLFK